MHDAVASTRHALGFLVIVVLVMAAGFAAQHREVAGGGLVATHAHVIPVYVSAIVLNWLLALYVWKGIRRKGVTVASLVGGSWGTPRAILRDLAIAAAFWGVFLCLAWATRAALGPGGEKSVDILLPRTALEIAVWIATSVTAGLCEEFVFRGYVQRQCAVWSRSAAVAIVGQGLVFGVMHAYQGWRSVVAISVLGVAFGALAAWRKTLRVGMVAHAWQDVWAGWLSRLIAR